MDDVRPLHQVFTALTGTEAEPDPAALGPAARGFDLPDDLLTEAIISFADTAPAEVAAHLAPFVTAHSPIAAVDPIEPAELWDAAQGLELLAGAPTGFTLSEPYVPDQLDDLDDLDGLDGLDGVADPASAAGIGSATPEVLDLGFGYGDHQPAAVDPLAPADDDAWDTVSADPWPVTDHEPTGVEPLEGPAEEPGPASTAPDDGYGAGEADLDEGLDA